MKQPRIDFAFRYPRIYVLGTNARMKRLSNFRTPDSVDGWARNFVLQVCKCKIDLFRH